jgi:NAD(P) transhydrogenase subunit alpha
MKIAVLKERRTAEARVAASPETVKRLIALGAEIAVEAGAGGGASFSDAEYKEAGAKIAADAEKTAKGAAIVLKVQRPMSSAEGEDELSAIPNGAILVALLDPLGNPDSAKAYAAQNITAFSLELVPRISRAQSMDVLSSQSNVAGYKAVLDAGEHYGRLFPMMMTAAGRINPAKVFVMGAGVAGLQAIATARRLGGVVSATDVRPAVKEQVESLGASFVMVESDDTEEAETAGGYAKEMSDDYKRRQAELVAAHVKAQDIVITTALIPGRAAPELISKDMVKSMKPGSVIVDLAVEQGGNVAGSKPGEVVDVDGVTIVGHLNVPSRLAADASELFARNVLNFLDLIIDQEAGVINLDWDDEIIAGTGLTRDGEVVHPAVGGTPKEVPSADDAKADPIENSSEDSSADAGEDASKEGEGDG